jgi:hypothetical protein
MAKDPKLESAGVSGYNKPKRTPKHPTKSHVVVAKEGDKTKTIRFGDQKMSIKKDRPARKKSYCARSSGIKGANSKLSANFWSRRAWDC